MMFTVIAKWNDGSDEEFDVDAPTRAAAKALVERQLEEDYLPGWFSIEVVEYRGVFIISTRV